jgi:hypothetical protein
MRFALDGPLRSTSAGDRAGLTIEQKFFAGGGIAETGMVAFVLEIGTCRGAASFARNMAIGDHRHSDLVGSTGASSCATVHSRQRWQRCRRRSWECANRDDPEAKLPRHLGDRGGKCDI